MADHIQTLEARVAQATALEDHVDALNALAREIRRTDVRRALSIAQQANTLACAPSHSYPRGQADSLLTLSTCNRLLGQNEQALAHALEALAVYQQLNDPTGQQATLSHLGALYCNLGEYPTALDFQLQFLSLAEQSGDLRNQSTAALQIGFTYSEMGRYAETFPYYDRGLTLCQACGDIQTEARILNSYCVDSTNIGEYSKALAHGRRSLQIFETIGDVYGQGVALGSIGEAQAAAGQYAEALESLLQALGVLRAAGNDLNSYEAICISYQIGLANLRRGDLDQALLHLQQTLASASAAQIKIVEYQCHERLAELFERRGDLRQALEHYRLFHAKREQVFNETSDQKLKNLEVLHRTQQAFAEAERQKQLREDDRHYFEQLAKLQREFFSTATHDLKNPLSGLSLGIDLLELHITPTDKDAFEILAGMRGGIERMIHLIADILDLAKLETGRALVIEPIMIAPLLRMLVQDHRLAADQKQLTLDLQVELGDLAIECDAAQLRRALDNLISNAIKYTPIGGRVTLIARYTPADMIIKVIDTGIGIPTHDLPHLFERFYRIRDADHLEIEGTGLGLAIVKAIVEQHGGQVWAESQLGAGSIFSLRMPLSRARPR